MLIIVDASESGALLSKSYNEAYEIIERIANNNYQWPTSQISSGKKIAGMLELDVITSLAAQVSTMSNMMKNMQVSQPPVQSTMMNTAAIEEVSCVCCSE